jgi:hypothetical protein
MELGLFFPNLKMEKYFAVVLVVEPHIKYDYMT